MNEHPHTELNRFIDRLLAGETTADEMAEWEARLMADKVLRRHYRSRMRMEANLHSTFEAERPELIPPLMSDLAVRPQRRCWLLSGGLGIAAALVLGFFLGSGKESDPEMPAIVAYLESESEAAWAGDLPVVAGKSFGVGTLELKAGLAELRFESGVLLSLEAPARLDLIDPMRCRLHEGMAVLDVPESGEGFIVETPGGHAVDHGTRFAVNVAAAEESADFEVLSGRISVHHTSSGAIADLMDSEAVRLTFAGLEKLDRLPSFVLNRPGEVGVIRLQTGGRETSIIRLESEEARSKFLDPDLLMVKRDTSTPGWGGKKAQIGYFARDRRSLVGFKLNGIEPGNLRSASLQLNLVPTGLGYASRLPETCTFKLYGIRDDAVLESWPTEGLKWTDAPGYADDKYREPLVGAAVDTTEVRLLARVEIPRGKVTGPVVFESPELTEFVRQDSTGEVGFVLVRDTPPLDGYSLVHAFAASTHPDAAGPTLKLEMEETAEPSFAGLRKF